MADEESQVQEDTSWWEFDAFADSDLPSMSIDEPLEWPDSSPWEEFSAAGPAVDPSFGLAPPEAGDSPAARLFPPSEGPDPADLAPVGDLDVQWQDAGVDDGDPTVLATPLAGLGGGAAPRAPGSAQSLSDSIWAAGVGNGPEQHAAAAGNPAVPMVFADGEGRRGRWLRHLDIRRGNVAIVALIASVSLVLLGMFMSVRSRNELPTDTSRTGQRGDGIAVQGTLNTVPLTTTATTAPGPVINIADLVPPVEGGATAGATAGTTGGSEGSGGSGGSPAATAAPRSAAPAGGSTGTTQPAPEPQSTATTAPPTTPPPTDPPDDTTDTTDTTQPRTSTSITIPSRSIPCPTFPPGFPSVSFPGCP